MLLLDLWSLLVQLLTDEEPPTAEPESGPAVDPHG
jgi:hypothetical protein